MSSNRSIGSGTQQSTLPQPEALQEKSGGKRVIFIFVDGLGLGRADAKNNPVYTYHLPGLEKQLGPMYELKVGDYRRKEGRLLVALDACLGVDGLPQSATGTAALLCGRNFPKELGRHLPGLPPQALREEIAKDNLFLKLKQKGLSATYANAYIKERPTGYLADHPSVTTIVAQSTMPALYDLADLRAGRAVFHDIDNSIIILFGYEVNYITPHKAASNLVEISRNFDLTLFEFFQTDLVGHSRDMFIAGKVLHKLSEFIGGVVGALPADTALIVASDHGNFEDFSVDGHTRNPVPLAIFGPEPLLDMALDRVGDISHVCGLVVEWLGGIE
jgi:2,3-bisphosphoglycerate-independent phosphoglycerate mutase